MQRTKKRTPYVLLSLMVLVVSVSTTRRVAAADELVLADDEVDVVAPVILGR